MIIYSFLITMNLPLFFSLVTGLIIGSLWLGRNKDNCNTTEEFFLMGRRLGGFGLVMTLLATQIGGGALLGASEEAYRHGWLVVFYPLGMALGMALLGLGFGARLQSLRLSTIAEIFERVYGSVKLRKAAALLSVLSLFLILGAQAIAARKFLSSIGFSSDLWFIGVWLALTCYTVTGGLNAVVKTDILQAGYIIVVFVIAFFGIKGGTTAPVAPPVLTESAPWITWLCMPLFFMLIEQDMAQRCSAAGSARTISRSALITSALLLLISLVPIWLGVKAATTGIIIPAGGSVLIEAVKQLSCPAIATSMIVAILMAIISTADSLLCAISSNIACDFSLGKNLRSCRIITVCVGIASLVLSFLFNSVVSLLMFAYELSVALLFVPILMAMVTKNPSKKGALVSLIIGGATLPLYRTHPIPFLLPLLYAFGGYWIMALKEKRALSPTRSDDQR